VRAVLLVLLVASCWRETPREKPYVSFVARVHALTELRRGTESLAPRIARMDQRIRGLASEAEREALHGDMQALEQDLLRLIQIAEAARGRNEDPALLAEIDAKLDAATVATVTLRGELRHAKTTAEQEAFEELKKKVEGTHDGPKGPIRIYRRDPVPSPLKPDPILLP
jgi:hypothetical protein